MLTIGQFSKVCLVTVKTLHHYDKIGLMTPECTDETTGYRYYSREQVSRMLLIQRLKRYGFQLSEIKEILTCGDNRLMMSRLVKQKEDLGRRLDETLHVIKEMNQHLESFERTGNIMGYQNNYDVKLVTTTDRAILSSRQMMSMEDFGRYYGKLFEQIAKDRLTIVGPTLAIYHDEEFNYENNDTEVAVMIAEKEKATRVMKGCLCAGTMHYGPYSSLSDAYGALTKWIDENGYEIVDAPYEVYMRTQFENLPPEKWETEVFFPVAKKA